MAVSAQRPLSEPQNEAWWCPQYPGHSTSYDDDTDVKEMSERLSELKQSLLELDIELELKVNERMHDREIRIDNGWTVKIGRGLDFFQRPDSWFGVGANDLNLRKCLETKVDIFKH